MLTKVWIIHILYIIIINNVIHAWILEQRIAKLESKNFEVKAKNAQMSQEHAELLERNIN
jgi:uncharacterized membrane protein YecN with MAPEG domain